LRFFFKGLRVFGIRPGISFGPRDFSRAARAVSRAQASQMTGGFVYVLSDQSGRQKIGSSKDPISLRNTLQTGSAEKLSFTFIGVSPFDTYVEIERAAQKLLETQLLTEGGKEWFKIPSSIAVGAVFEVAQRLDHPIQQIPPDMVPDILALAHAPDPMPRPTKTVRVVKWILWVLLGMLAALIAVAIFVPAPPPT
jgi:hypothetical protein